jgi:probable HAF family extracellular repeat protein
MKLFGVSALLALSLLSRAAPIYSFKTIQFPGALHTHAAALNNTGQIVGGYSTGVRAEQGFVYQSGVATPLDFPESDFTLLSGINDTGQIVGTFSTAGSLNSGFLYSDGVFTALTIPGSIFSNASGINNAGQIVGHMQDETGGHGYVGTNGSFRLLDIPGGSFQPKAINNTGQIVGQGSPGSMLYNNGVFTRINVPGSFATLANGINDAGQIVGYYFVGGEPGPFLQHGFVLENGVYTTIDVPGSIGATGIYGINNAGQIVGTFIDNDRGFGFLGTPVPEPASALLLTFGLAAIAIGVRLRR